MGEYDELNAYGAYTMHSADGAIDTSKDDLLEGGAWWPNDKEPIRVTDEDDGKTVGYIRPSDGAFCREREDAIPPT